MLPTTLVLFASYALFITHARAYPQTPSVSEQTTESPAVKRTINEVFDLGPDEPMHDSFSLQLLKHILSSTTTAATSKDSENVIFSPFSAQLVLALLTESTGNGTHSHQELLDKLGDIKDVENLRSFYRKTLATLKPENPNYTLQLNTRLYTDTSIKLVPRYAELLNSTYETPTEQMEFGDGVVAAEKINSWIAHATENCLQQLVTPDCVADSVILLVNAIYFKGKWVRQFTHTQTGDFFRKPSAQVKASYMELTAQFKYYNCSVLNAKILELPYHGNKLSMFVVLPNDGSSIDSLLKRMENQQLKEAQTKMTSQKVSVKLPKFKFDYKTDLKEVLISLGVKDIFTKKAELTAMVDDNDSDLMVSNILQKSGIDVNEQGTEAAVAAVATIETRIADFQENTEFVANRPFMFFIEEESTGNILFAGKVMNPTL